MRAFHVRDASWAALWLLSLKPAQNSRQLTATDKVLAGGQLQAWEPDQGRTCPSATECGWGGGGGLVIPHALPSIPPSSSWGFELAEEARG